MKLPSFPQRGQTRPPQILELPDGAPAQLAQWLAKARFTQQMVKWFSLIRPEFEVIHSEMNAGMGQLVGQARSEAESVLREGMKQLVGHHDVDQMIVARMTMILSVNRPTPMGARPWSEFQVIQGLRASKNAEAQFHPAFFIETDSRS